MTTLNVNTIKPAGATLTLGESGDSVVFADDVKVNTVADVGGNTLWTSNGSGVVSSVRGGVGGAMKLLSTQTASGSANLSFTSGIDSTYDEYIFKFYNLNPATNGVEFSFQGNASGQTGFNETIQSTSYLAWAGEGSGGALGYLAGGDQANGTAYQQLMDDIGNGADEMGTGELHLISPSNTTFVTHFWSTTQCYEKDNQIFTTPTAGYFNTTAAITQIDFKMSSGNFDGVIKMYGIAS